MFPLLDVWIFELTVYLNLDDSLIDGVQRIKRLMVIMDSFETPVCTSSSKMGILKE